MLQKGYSTAVWFSIAATAVSLFLMGLCLKNSFMGNIDSHILSSQKFGVPDSLKTRGIKPFFTDTINEGWDGQFYFYISNDLGYSQEMEKITENVPFGDR